MLALAIALPAIAVASETSTTFTSGDDRVALIELFTSEGCNSCPPADRWLSQLDGAPGLWTSFVPVAFHVDYWDYIGWRDRFASPDFSDRQRRYAAEGGTRVVYTPGFFRNGTEWRDWRRRETPSGRSEGDAGRLTVEVNGGQSTIEFEPGDIEHAALQAHIAILGMGLSSDVRAGENRGKTLKHDFVVLGVASVTLIRHGATYRARTRLPDMQVDAQRIALAAWISAGDRQRPVQATGGILAGR